MQVAGPCAGLAQACLVQALQALQAPCPAVPLIMPGLVCNPGAYAAASLPRWIAAKSLRSRFRPLDRCDGCDGEGGRFPLILRPLDLSLVR